MALRCGCENDGDETVFGSSHRCSVSPKPPADLPRFIPSWAFVVPPEPRYMETLDESERTGD